MVLEDCSIILILSLMLSTLERKEKRARRMFKLLCSVSYYTRMSHCTDVTKIQIGIDIDKYMKCSTNHECQFTKLIGGTISSAI
jgi:hypothetical protein